MAEHVVTELHDPLQQTGLPVRKLNSNQMTCDVGSDLDKKPPH